MSKAVQDDMELREIAIEELNAPERSNKLHPYEDEDEDDWEEFCRSIGTQPNKPLEVTPNGSGFDIIDGDRRFRALKENDVQSARCFVVQDEGDSIPESDKILKMITANEFRKSSNKKQRARQIASICAPWLLPPGERSNGLERQMTHSELSEEVGKSKPTIGRWLTPVKQDNPIRSSLADKGTSRKPTEEETEVIDEIVSLLTNGATAKVVSMGQEKFVSEELSDMEGVSLSEIRTAAEKGVDENWNEREFLEYLNEHYAYDEIVEEEGDDIEFEDGTGDSVTFEDVQPQEDQFSGINESEPETSPETEEEEHDFSLPDVEVDWSEHVDEDELDVSLNALETRQMMPASIEDEASVAIHIAEEKFGMDKHDVVKQIVEPMIVEGMMDVLADE